MAQLNATKQYNLVQEGKLSKSGFVQQMRQQFPNLINQFNGFDDTVKILKNKRYLTEAKIAKATIKFEDTISPDVVLSGIDCELKMKGILAKTDPKYTKEEYSSRGFPNFILG